MNLLAWKEVNFGKLMQEIKEGIVFPFDMPYATNFPYNEFFHEKFSTMNFPAPVFPGTVRRVAGYKFSKFITSY